MARVPDLPPGPAVDLGSGAGAVAADLRARFCRDGPGRRRLIGVDRSDAMLAEAEATGLYDDLHQADIALWSPEDPPALIFSNAALQWLPDHPRLFPRLAAMLAPGGTLAVQMPRQHEAPSHALLREIAARRNPETRPAAWTPPVAPPAAYARLLAPLGEVSVWETEYLQRLAPDAGAHPVRRFTESTAMRPFVDGLSAEEARAFAADYDERLALAYPAEADGSVLFPFRRLFILLTAGGQGGIGRMGMSAGAGRERVPSQSGRRTGPWLP